MPNCRPNLKHAAPLGVDAGKPDFDRHADLLEESGLSRSVNKIQRAITVRRLQRDHGTPYVQKLIEHISRRRSAQIREGITGSGASGMDAARINAITEQMRLRN